MKILDPGRDADWGEVYSLLDWGLKIMSGPLWLVVSQAALGTRCEQDLKLIKFQFICRHTK